MRTIRMVVGAVVAHGSRRVNIPTFSTLDTSF
jgi:hypothetical protein